MQEVYKDFGVKVYSIVTMADIIAAIEDGIIDGKEYLDKMKENSSRRALPDVITSSTIIIFSPS